MIEVTAPALAAHPFLRGLPLDQLAALAGTATVVTFPARCRLFEEGGNATRFWLIRSGRVALDLDVPGQGRQVIETLGMGEVVGWSWMFPPYQWAFGAAAVTPVEAVAFDAAAVRACCAADPLLGLELNWRLTRMVVGRLQTTRIRLLTWHDLTERPG
jgi:CRP/FNR family transcriptional regulator, cyclic AMP receptor protein